MRQARWGASTSLQHPARRVRWWSWQGPAPHCPAGPFKLQPPALEPPSTAVAVEI